MRTDEAMKRVSAPLGEVVQALQASGADQVTVNEALKAMLPLLNYTLRLDARLTSLERQMRTQRQVSEER
ncbi:hypothetical protein [Alloyangia pacifica]|uniref:hypothetical protein n=1 Tax=Alloyangia pacifica TaxID=311180 RepID=UPI001CFD61F6|nr:hypothetical protein [Alloyangia pacifica]